LSVKHPAAAPALAANKIALAAAIHLCERFKSGTGPIHGSPEPSRLAWRAPADQVPAKFRQNLHKLACVLRRVAPYLRNYRVGL